MVTTSPHVLVMPCPSQGRVIPLLEISQCLAKHGFRVTFVNSGVFSRQGLESIRRKELCWGANVKTLATIPQVMSEKLEELIEEINGRQGEKIDCVIADGVMGWAIEVAKRLKIEQAAVWTSSAASLALSFSIPKLIDDGIIDSKGTPMKKQRIQLAPNMPAISGRARI